MSMVNLLGDKTLTKMASTTAGTVYVMTGLKAIGRPIFIYADKNSDPKTKKYTAGKEFLYQLLCLAITLSIIPFFKIGGLKLAEKYVKKTPKGIKVLEELSKTKNIFKQLNIFNKAYKEVKNLEAENPYKKAMNMGHGGVELGAFVGSILGLTIVAPLLSHKILHPIMNALGFESKKVKNIIQTKKDSKINVQA